MKISAVLIVKNEEKKIRRCLESIKWCDEIIVVDQSSTDKTVDIAKEYTDKIFTVEEKLICEPDRKFAVSQAENEWVLLLDADEVVDESLKTEILEEISKGEKEVFYIPRKNFFCGKWIKTCGWYPGYVPRLFKKNCVLFEPKIHMDGKVLTDKVGYLKNDLLHYSYETIDDWIEKFKRYTSQYAIEYLECGMKVNLINTIKELFLRPMYFFLLKYVILKGFLDGWRGFFISLSSALTIVFSYLKFIALYEQKKLSNNTNY